MGLVLDSGGMIAFDRGDREVAAFVEATRRRRERIATSSGCVAQAWRRGGPGQALLARLLEGVDERALDQGVSRTIGSLCARAGSNDVIDAHVALLAGNGDLVLTSDPEDLRTLIRATGSGATIRRC
ncbi:MAG: PIN domain-containing protein [Actinomycetota bacterium]